MMQKYFQMDVDPITATADIVIYGDITSWPWVESDVSSYGLSKSLAELHGVSQINVRINSYGGEVAEGIAIYNALKSHPAKVTTVCDGFACSIASVIFMAGDERVMNEASLLMIHNAWTHTAGNADELRKEADDLDTITGLSKAIYLAKTDLDEDELTEWMDSETFIDSATALERGFATKVEPIAQENAAQSALGTISRMLTANQLVSEPRTAVATIEIDPCEVMRKLGESLLERFPAPAVDNPEPDADDGRLRMAGAYLALNK